MGIVGAQSMLGTEVVVDLDVDLLALVVFAQSQNIVAAACSPNPFVARDIQAVANFVIVHGRHKVGEAVDESAGIPIRF